MALWYKAWRESRARFLIGAAALTFFCVMAARIDLNRIPFSPRPTFAQYIWGWVYDGVVVLLFGIFAAMLGLGGLHAERTSGSHEFTLALPVTRPRLMFVRSAVALAQTTALACIPLLTVPFLSRLYQEAPYPTHQAAMFAVLFTVCGAAWCTAGILWSTLLRNEHAVAACCLLTPFVGRALTAVIGVDGHANLFQIMNGVATAQLNPRMRLLEGPMPWITLLVVAIVGGAFLVTAYRVTEQQDF